MNYDERLITTQNTFSRKQKKRIIIEIMESHVHKDEIESEKKKKKKIFQEFSKERICFR